MIKSEPIIMELETLRDLGRNGNARIFIGFDKHFQPNGTSDHD
jgi:hypothetical protein